MIRKCSYIAILLALVATAIAASAPANNQKYIAQFNQNFHKRSAPVALKDIASVQIYDSLYMGQSLDRLLASNLHKLGGDLAWGVAYRMISLNDMFRLTHDPKYLQANLRCIAAVLAVRDDHTGTKNFRGQSLPAWSSAGYSAHRTVFLVHTAMIIYPMLDAIELAQNSPQAPAKTKAELKNLLPEILQSIHLHDSQWRDGPRPGEGYYVGHDQEAVLEGKPIPANRLSAMGRCLWTTWLITKDPQYRTKAVALGWYIKHRLTLAQDGAYYWPYMLSQTPAATKPVAINRSAFPGEDTSHATLTVSFPIMLAENHEVFTDHDMQRFAKTVTDGWGRLANGVLFGDINGSPRSNASFVIDPAAWLCLSAYDPAVEKHILPFYLNYEQAPRPQAIAALIALQPVVKTFHVDQRSSNATDDGPGTQEQPFKTISKAASLAGPGDTVLVHAGVYREWISPARGGTADAPIVYRSIPEHAAIARGTDLLDAKWEPVSGAPGVFAATLPQKAFIFGDPFVPPPAPAKKQPQWMSKCAALVFFHDQRLNQVVTRQQLINNSDSWLSTDNGKQLLVHLNDNAAPAPGSIEITTRDRIFAPHQRGLGYIHVEGFVFERCATRPDWPQLGALSTRSGHDWIIRNNTVRQTTGKGIDCGSETWNPESLNYTELPDKHILIASNHLVENNVLTDNDQCGIAAWNTDYVQIIGNIVRDNASRGAEKPDNFLADDEAAGIKVHAFRHGLIERNLVVTNSSFGIWLDNGWENARVTRNVCIANRGAGIFVELGFGPILVDHNLSANTTPLWHPYLGDGMYTHDASNITTVHNTFLDNARDGLRELVVSERSYAQRRLCEASDEKISGNLFFGNREAAVSLPLDSPRSRFNHSDYNALNPDANFVINDCERRIPMSEINQFCRDALKAAEIPEKNWPYLTDANQLPILSFPAWQLIMQMEQNSTRLPANFHMHIDQNPGLLLYTGLPSDDAIPPAPATPGDDFDLLGAPIKPGNARAGAFQNLHAGSQTINLWPLPLN